MHANFQASSFTGVGGEWGDTQTDTWHQAFLNRWLCKISKLLSRFAWDIWTIMISDSTLKKLKIFGQIVISKWSYNCRFNFVWADSDLSPIIIYLLFPQDICLRASILISWFQNSFDIYCFIAWLKSAISITKKLPYAKGKSAFIWTFQSMSKLQLEKWWRETR